MGRPRRQRAAHLVRLPGDLLRLRRRADRRHHRDRHRPNRGWRAAARDGRPHQRRPGRRSRAGLRRCDPRLHGGGPRPRRGLPAPPAGLPPQGRRRLPRGARRRQAEGALARALPGPGSRHPARNPVRAPARDRRVPGGWRGSVRPGHRLAARGARAARGGDRLAGGAPRRGEPCCPGVGGLPRGVRIGRRPCVLRDGPAPDPAGQCPAGRPGLHRCRWPGPDGPPRRRRHGGRHRTPGGTSPGRLPRGLPVLSLDDRGWRRDGVTPGRVVPGRRRRTRWSPARAGELPGRRGRRPASPATPTRPDGCARRAHGARTRLRGR